MIKSIVTASIFAVVASANPLSSIFRRDLAPGPFNACPASELSQLSCHNTSAVTNSCCYEQGGTILQTQFWDTNPVQGPSASWTIHGLWPDNCDGTYDAFCDPSREVSGDNITSILESYGQHNLLRYMRRYWKDQYGNDSSLWSHEYNKHGTCFSTFKPECYVDSEASTPEKDVADYFVKTVSLFKTLPTYDFLKASGVVPSTTQNYTLIEIQSAIVKATGHMAYVGCSKKGVLQEMWYYYNVEGRVQDGTFVQRNPDGSTSSCPATGIQYLPKRK